MKFESTALGIFAAGLSVSAAMAIARSEEEYARRVGLKGTRVDFDDQGRSVEYDLTERDFDDGRPTLVLENGLGSPLESWDWVRYHLRGNIDVIRYHRRGYARTKSRLRPAQVLEMLLRRHAPKGRIIFASPSIGALITANALSASAYLEDRTQAVFFIDGTDEHALGADRHSKERRGKFRQIILQEALGGITGRNRWVTSSVERDVAYLPDVQRSFVVTGSSVRTQIAAAREYATEPIGGQEELVRMGTSIHVVSAADNVEQQTVLATRLCANITVVPRSSHRSIIGRLDNARLVSELILRETDVL